MRKGAIICWLCIICGQSYCWWRCSSALAKLATSGWPSIGWDAYEPDCTGTKRPEVHSTQSEAFTTDRAPFDGDAVVWKTVTVGLGAAWIALLALVGVACVVRAIERRDKCGLLYAVLAAEGAQSIVRWCKFKYINDVTDTASRPGSSAPGGSILGTPELFLTLAGALAATALTAIDGFTLYTEVRGQSGGFFEVWFRRFGLVSSRGLCFAGAFPSVVRFRWMGCVEDSLFWAVAVDFAVVVDVNSFRFNV
uniref:Uncharacterized protein n=1 Tax=Anopheles coluzzii TaxID=1518534 RepID=A0A8W7P6R4_ANOCL